MTLPLFGRRPASRPRRRIVEARNYWRIVDGQPAREVLVRDYDGQLRRTYLPDEHPALVAFIERAAVAA